MRGYFLATIILSLCAATPASAAFYTYSQWRALPEEMRAGYIAGAFDLLITIVPGEETDTRYTKHWLARATAVLILSPDGRDEWQS